MSTDKLDRVTAIASRQPGIHPARHQVSPAVLEFRLQQVKRERDALAECLKKSAQALDDWINTYASEMCDAATVRRSRERISDGGGTLFYVASIREEACALLAKIGGA